MSSQVVLETVDFPENLSVSLANLLGTAVKTYYLGPRLPGPSPALHSWAAPATGQTEYYWTTELPAAPPGTPAPGHVPVTVRLIITPNDVRVEYTSVGPLGEDQRRALTRMTDDLRAFIVSFLQFAKRSSLYLAVPPYPASAAGKEKPMRSGSDALRSIFSGNSTNVFLLVLVLTLPAVLFLGYYALVLMVGAQGIVLYFSDRIALRVGSVAPSAQQPRGTVIGVTLRRDPQSPGPIELRVSLSALRTQLREAIAASEGRENDLRDVVVGVLGQAGIHCSKDDVEVTTRDVYNLVEKAARRFDLPTPKVVLTEAPISNAAATGISPQRASMVITAGSLEELSDQELEAVVGHELGHIRGRDSVILMSANAVLYLGAVFVWPSVLLYLGFAYFVLALAIVYLLGKILETRADTLSAMVLGGAGDLAAALTNMAFKELYGEERSHPIRFLRWFTPDPHPPVYFRVDRLVKFSTQGLRTRHPFLVSARDCLSGFFRAMVGRD
jgi:heat shock protein HtpX